MLLHGRVGDARFQKLHLLPAAHDGNLAVGEFGDDIAAVLTDIEIHISLRSSARPHAGRTGRPVLI